jgi:hypothetical protein
MRDAAQLLRSALTGLDRREAFHASTQRFCDVVIWSECQARTRAAGQVLNSFDMSC